MHRPGAKSGAQRGAGGAVPGPSSGAGAAPTTTVPQHPVLHWSCMEINAQPGTWSSFSPAPAMVGAGQR